MKKVFISLTLLVCILSSCNKQEETLVTHPEESITEKAAMNELMLNLKEYNTSFLIEHSHNQTRGLWGWLKRLARTVYADAAGGLLGASCGPWGAVCGATISSAIVFMADKIGDGSAVHPPLKPIITRGDDFGEFGGNPTGTDENYMNINALNYTVLSSNSGLWADSVGYYHNSILMHLNEDQMLDNNNSFFLNLTINRICQQADGMSANGRGSTTNSQLLSSISYSQLKTLLEDNTYSDSFDDFVNEIIALYPEHESELEFLKDYIEALCEIEQSQNNGTYAQGVLNLVHNSNISNTAKQRLGNAIIAGNASARLWNFDNL